MTTRNATFLVAGIAALTVLLGVGCDGRATVDRVQTNLIDKSVFEGEWWFTTTVIDLEDDGALAIGQAGAGAPWPGAMSNYDIASQSGTMGRIRWVIDEDFIYAYRATEVIVGSNPDARDPDFRGSPLAAFRIEGHVDVRADYNPVTGERSNVIVENTTDRRWYERQFIRVDWSRNLVSWGLFGASLEIDELFATFRRESVPLGITDEGNQDLPAEWAPQFVRIGDDDTYRFRSEWPAGTEDTVHYMSFVTQSIWTPLQCFGSGCSTSLGITTRSSFLRVPPQHEYAVESLSNSEYDRFGIIRTEQRTYIRGGQGRDTLARYCEADSDCGACDADGNCQVACDVERHICVGGLIDELGETDFLTYYRLRHNFYSDSLTDQTCTADWQCSRRYEEGGTAASTAGGSVCDQYARRCTIPLAQRPTRPVTYTLSPHYPRYLIRSAFEVISFWNEAFMRGNRELGNREAPTGPRIACQGDNPVDYCFCNERMTAPEVGADRTCEWHQDFFRSPEEQVAEGVMNPYECQIVGPADAEHPGSYEAYGEDHTQFRFVGEECLLQLEVNACDRDPEAECQQLGDIRYNMFNFVSGAGAGWCGVMQPNQDPNTGEAIVSPINMGGQCLDNYGLQPLVLWPILRGEEPVEGFINGEEARQYFAALGNVQPARGITAGADDGYEGSGPRPAIPVDLERFFEQQMQAIAGDVVDLHGAEGRELLSRTRVRTGMGAFRESREGQAFERRLAAAVESEGFPTLSVEEQLAAAAMDSPGAMRSDVSVSDDATLDRISPLSDDFMSTAMLDTRREQRLLESGTCMMFDRSDIAYASEYNTYWAEAFRGVPLEEARIRWSQAWHRTVMQHELGHGLGLEHNFAGTFDRHNFQSGWYEGAVSNPLPLLDQFDANRDGDITASEHTAWIAALDAAREERNRLGVANFATSSSMDYSEISDIMGIGPYDRAAVYFNYFNQVEAYQGDSTVVPCTTDAQCPTADGTGTGVCDEGRGRCVIPTDSSIAGLSRPDLHSRVHWTWYRGGEGCNTDAQCPYAAGSAALASDQAVTQHCVTNPRFSSIPVPCAEGGGEHCVCSNFDEDFVDYAGANRVDPPFTAITYLFCSNPRLNDISWCNTYDQGESFQEALSHWRHAWENRYLTSYFRRFRRGFTSGSRALRYVSDAAKVYQHLFFRYFYEPRFRSQVGPLGFADQYLASIDTMNWLSQLAQMPDVGSYRMNATTGTWEHMGEELDMPGSMVSLEPGEGYYHWSRYQEGLYGFFRLERAGVFWDQLFALRALTQRDWGLSFTIDERYYINFYDLFPVEMTELFGGYVIDDPAWFAPRMTVTAGGEPQIQYVNWFRGGCSDPGTGATVPCRPDTATAFPGTPIAGTSNEILRVYAAIFALSEFPIFYDTTWEQRLAVFALGNADGFTIPDMQADGESSCAYGDITTSAAHRSGCSTEEADYITYTSDRVHTTYVAVKMRPRLTYNLEEEQLGFQLLLRLNELQDRVRTIDDDGVETAEERELRRELERNESFLTSLIEVQRIFGITSWL